MQPLTLLPAEFDKKLRSLFCDLKPDKSQVEQLAKKPFLRELFSTLSLSTEDSYVRSQTIEFLHNFIPTQTTEIANYLCRKHSLNELCHRMIDHIRNYDLTFDAGKFLQELKAPNALLDKTVKEQIADLSPRDQLNLLGFGLGEGAYEKNLAEYFRAENVTASLHIFGFDPFSIVEDDDIRMLTRTEIHSQDCPHFDLMLARWTLHHVSLEYRWKDLLGCLDHCKRGSRVLFVEEGCFSKDDTEPVEYLAYELIHAAADVIVNSAFNPHWVYDPNAKPGDHYFIKYLTQKDLDMINKSATVDMQMDFRHLHVNYFPQTLIIFDIR
jgi:hypothetical protein